MSILEKLKSSGNLIAPTGRSAIIAGVVAAVVAGSSVGALALTGSDDLPSNTVMRIGDETVTVADFQARVDSLKALYGVTEPEEADKQAGFLRDAAKSLAMSLLLEKEAARLDIVVPKKQAETELSKIISSRLGGDRSSFVTYLGSAGVSEEQVLDEISRTIATSRLFDEVTKEVKTTTADEAKAEFDARKDEMTTAEKRRVSDIVVESEEDAQKVIALIRGGQAYASVARSYSMDQESKAQGGDLGTHTANEMEAAFSDVAFKAKVGEIFGPVQTQYGWNVGKVTKILPGTPLTFAQVKDTLVQALTSQAKLKVWREWLAGVLKKGDVEYADKYRPSNPTSVPEDVATTSSGQGAGK